MNRNLTKAGNDFYVLCNACGKKVRQNNREDRSRLCLKCFYKILDEHLKAQKHTPYGEFVSDR